MIVIPSSPINCDFLFRVKVITKDLELRHQRTWSCFKGSWSEGPSEEFTSIFEELYEDVSEDPLVQDALQQPNEDGWRLVITKLE